MAACSLLFVNVRLWLEYAENDGQLTRANAHESRRTTKKDAERMHVQRLAGHRGGFPELVGNGLCRLPSWVGRDNQGR